MFYSGSSGTRLVGRVIEIRHPSHVGTAVVRCFVFRSGRIHLIPDTKSYTSLVDTGDTASNFENFSIVEFEE